VGLTDHIQELQGGKLVPIEKLGVQGGSDPHVSSDCRILYHKGVAVAIFVTETFSKSDALRPIRDATARPTSSRL
jgi:hypothetical protein